MKMINVTRARLQKNYIEYFPRWHFLLAGGLLAALIFLVQMPSNEMLQQDLSLGEESAGETFTPLVPQSTPLTFEELDLSPQTSAESQDPTQKTETVRKGDNLSSIFQRAGLNNKDLAEVTDTCKEAKSLKQLQPGHKFTFKLDDKGVLQRLAYTPNLLETQNFVRQDSKFVYSETLRKPDILTKVGGAEIKSSLYEAGKSAQISDLMVLELAKIFAYDIDFALDLRRGDSFKVLYEEAFVDGKKIGNGEILAAEFTNDGVTYRAVRYQDRDGQSRFYSPDGKSSRKGFLRSPVEFAHISSGFNLGRLHPILNKIRAHKGTDYAARTGTPIMASGDGKVSLAGTYSGYGNCIIIQHDKSYTTLYGHMSRFASGVRKGSTVKQGQVIGYVGSTGLATGPHLHYEFHVNGKVVNPVTVELPKAQGIARSEMPRFMAQTQSLVAQLNGTTAPNMAADRSRNNSGAM